MALRYLTNRRARLSLALCVAVCFLTGVAPAQQPIRVETKQVLVPVIVIDKDRKNRLWKSGALYDAVLPGEADAIVSGILIHGLIVADFQVLDDGKEQAIESVTEEQSFYWDMRDNKGYHTEYIGPGGGKWSTTQWPAGIVTDIDAPQLYVIAYTLPASPEGSCHQIKVIVKRRNAMVRVRPEYCNSEHSAWDLVYGTDLGKQMEAFQSLENKEMVNVSLTAMSLHRKSEVSRVHIVVEWPWQRFERGDRSRTKGVLGVILDKQGNLVTRFSDVAEREGVAFNKREKHHSEIVGTEARYEKQVDLSPSEYKLRVVVGDGKTFGEAEIPLIADSYDGKEFTISSLSLCRQIDDFSSYGHESVLPGAWAAKLPDSYIPLVSNGTQFKPTPNTGFKKGENLYTYFEVYEPLLAEPSPVSVEIQLRVVDAKSGDVVTASESISATQYVTTGNPVIPIGRGINISNLPKGCYRLEVQATDSAGKSTPWRSANFTVE
jgi:hypothetical protein